METPEAPESAAAPTLAPPVAAVVIARRPGDLGDVLDAVTAQAYSPTSIFVVGQDPIGLSDAPVRRVATMAEMVAEVPSDVDYLWVVDQDARPRPDALEALVGGAERVDASVAGSKLLRAESPDELVSVGASTDVFGVPYTGLDTGEVDQEQYDVVRDVAFVEPASLLVRRDLFTGLGGLDTHIPFESSGIDLCQRARLNGARVIVVPSAEALLVGAFPDRTKTWREQAGRIRAMLKSYSLVTLLWAIPGLALIGLATSVYDTFRSRPLALADYVRAWAWNLLHIGSTISGRARARNSRQAGDDELFLYQIGGSVELKALTEGLSDRLANPDEEAGDLFEADVLELPGFWQQPTFIAGFIGLLYVAFVTRSVWTDQLPIVGFSLPLRESALATLTNYAGGWNAAELGAPVAHRPVVGITALIQLLMFSRAGVASMAITVGAVILGVLGMARLLRHFGIGTYARTFAGIVLMTGPTAAHLAGSGAWPGLVAIGIIPWTVALALAPPAAGWRRWAWVARIAFASAVAAAFAPLALAVTVAALVLGAPLLGHWRRAIVGAAAALTAVVALLPWAWTEAAEDLLTAGTPIYFDPRWWIAAWIGVTMLAALMLVGRDRARLASWGAILAAGGLFVARSARLGIGRDLSVAGLILASLGLAVVTAVVLSLDTGDEVSSAIRSVRRLGILAGIGMVVLALGPLIGGRVGLPGEDLGSALAFAETRAEPHGSDRILMIGPGEALPGEPRRMSDGTAYRLIGGPRPHLDEAWTASQRLGDETLAGLLEELALGGELRPGARLAEFGVRWVVFTGPTTIEQRLGAQLDLRPLPDLEFSVFENDESSPRAVTDRGVAWRWTVPGYEGAATGANLRIAENADPGWGPGEWSQADWANSVTLEGSGPSKVGYEADARRRLLAILSGAFVLVLLGVSIVARIEGARVDGRGDA